jgi:hypothetical protein
MGEHAGRTLGLALMVATTALAGCGSKVPPGVTGTIHGETFSMAEAMATYSPKDYSGVSIGSRTGLCPCSEGDSPFGDLQLIGIVFATPGGGMPTQPGSYSVVSPNSNNASLAPGTANVFYQHFPACGQGAAIFDTGTSGTITLSRVDSAELDGSGDVTFQGGDHVTVGFTAPTCAATQPACALYCP